MMGSSDSLNGLTFGKKVYFEYVGSGGGSSSKKGVADQPPAPAPAPAAAKKGKWAVVQQQQQQTPRCQVEGCSADLTGVKAYYCRHKVCGMHSKSPKVVVAGIEQRFCQQCSRFHQLNEFDQVKRSCRRRLAGHNQRRRKPPPGILPSGYGRLSSSDENRGFRGFLMDFRAPWPTGAAGDHRAASSSQWQGSFSAPHGAAAAHPYMQPPPHFAAHELPSSGRSLAGVTDASCALSLLSDQTWGGVDASPRSRAVWGFKGHGAGNTSQEIQQDVEIGHFGNGHGRFSGELELALQGNGGQLPDPMIPARSCDHSGPIMHWPL